MLKFQKNKPLSDLSTFRIGGPAEFFIVATSVEEMQEILKHCAQEKHPFHIVGAGSNSLFPDEGLKGVVIQNKIQFLSVEGDTVEVGSGYSFSLLGTKTARLGLSGLEFASGIPATVGGAVYMNAGANGAEVKDRLEEVKFVTGDGELQTFSDASFGYRWSQFHRLKGAIVSARFKLKQSESARKTQLNLLEARKSSQPLKDPSCGCVFRNPEGKSAGALIDQCGLKGVRVGGAEVSDVHANFIVNRGGATAADVLSLAKQIRTCVKEKSGVELEFELKTIGR